MKPFTKRLALVMGLLFTALICCGIVFIDTTQNYWYVNGGFVKLIVSNQTAQAIMTVDTNTLRVGFNTNNTTFSWMALGRSEPTNVTGNGASAFNSGAMVIQAGDGQHSGLTTTASGGGGGVVQIQAGNGANANRAVTNATGGLGGAFNFISGNGGAGQNALGPATNAVTGGDGGSFNVTAGSGGAPSPSISAPTNTFGGAGGAIGITAGNGAVGTAGWARRSGDGGLMAFTAGNSGNAVRTNSGSGGSFSITAGTSGSVSTAPGNSGTPGSINLTAGNAGSAAAGGNPSPGGVVNITAGNGSTGTTNSNGGRIHLTPGSPGSGAVAGDVVVGRTAAGTSRGGLMVGPLLGGSVSITNVLGGAADLDFPSTVAGAFSEFTIAVTGVTSNNVAVSLSVPWQSAQTGGAFVTFNSNDVIYVRFINNQLATAIDPAPGNFAVVGFRIR